MKCENKCLQTLMLITLLLGVSSISFAESVTAANCIDGKWFVGVQELDGGVRQIGTLLISGYIYSYLPTSDAEVPDWMSDRFSFINAQTGRVEYEIRISSDEQIENIEDNTTLAVLSFSGRDEAFLVRVDRDSDQLYFHAQIGEIQMYEISKGF